VGGGRQEWVGTQWKAGHAGVGRWAHLLLHNLLVLLLDGCKQDVVPLVHQELGGGPAAWWGIQDAEGQLLTQVFQVQILVADLCVQKGR
jgi:hypothetical protein